MGAINGVQAVALPREHMLHVIPMDIRMPIIEGIEALKRLNSKLSASSIPVVAATGLSTDGDGNRIIAEEFDGCIPKPIIAQDFIARVKKYARKQDLRGGYSCQTGP